jgi:hypothetical protein
MTSDTASLPISPLRARMIEDMTRARLQAGHAPRLCAKRPSIRSLYWPVARHGDSGGSASLPTTPNAERHAAAEHQQRGLRGLGLALFLHGDARPAGSGAAAHRRAAAAAHPGGAQCRRGDAAAAGGIGAEVQSGVRHRLWRRAARLGSRRVEGRRHRFRAHAAARRARQGRQGPPRDAVAAAARTGACLVARRAAAQPVAAGRLAVSRPQPGRAVVGPPAWPRCPRRRSGRGDRQARVAAHAAAQLCHPPARARRRCPRDPDAPRPRQTRHHGTLHPRRQYDDPRRHQPARNGRGAG